MYFAKFVSTFIVFPDPCLSMIITHLLHHEHWTLGDASSSTKSVIGGFFWKFFINHLLWEEKSSVSNCVELAKAVCKTKRESFNYIWSEAEKFRKIRQFQILDRKSFWHQKSWNIFFAPKSTENTSEMIQRQYLVISDHYRCSAGHILWFVAFLYCLRKIRTVYGDFIVQMLILQKFSNKIFFNFFSFSVTIWSCQKRCLHAKGRICTKNLIWREWAGPVVKLTKIYQSSSSASGHLGTCF